MVLEETKFTRVFTNKERILLKLLVAMLFLGRAWQGLFWDLPLRTFFWDQFLLEGVVTTLTNDTWQNYVTNRSINIDGIINNLGFSLGFFWLFCAGLVVFVKREWKWGKWILYIGSLSFFMVAFLYFKEKFWQVGQLFEYTTQVTAPLILVYVIYGGQNTFRFRNVLRIIIAITFFCHGLYAYAYYPSPSIWVQWCMDIFHFKDDLTAKQFLIFIGVLDFLAASFLLINRFRPILIIVIWYCIVWGTLTAFARILGNFYANVPLESLHQHTYEALYRLVHGGIPLLLWFCYQQGTNDLKT